MAAAAGLGDYGLGGCGAGSELSLDLLDMHAVSSRMSALRAQAALLANAQQRLQDDMMALEVLITDQQYHFQQRQQVQEDYEQAPKAQLEGQYQERQERQQQTRRTKGREGTPGGL